MTPMRILTVLFWLFIGSMLAWQFYDYNSSVVEQAKVNPPDKHYFYGGVNPSAPPQPVVHEGPYVVQKHFAVEYGVPPGQFTCYVTLKNEGTVKAVSVQIHVRPYAGGSRNGGIDGHTRSVITVKDTDYIAQQGQWVSFPDLAPGESVTKPVVFLPLDNSPTGDNPNPQINYVADKSTP